MGLKKRHFVSKDNDYFKDGDEAIKLEHCADGGKVCKLQMMLMNEDLLIARKLIENKEFTRAAQHIKNAFDSTWSLKDDRCQGCAALFRNSVFAVLDHLISDLEDMTKGFFGTKKYSKDLERVQLLKQDILNMLERKP
jgi:hypothetical protein